MSNLKDNLAKGLKPLLIVSIASILLVCSYSRCLDNYELELLDRRFVLRGQQKTTGEIALVEIGDDTVEKLGQWPLARSYYAMMVKALSSAGAKAVIFDIIFADESAHDAQLEKSIKEAGNIYLPMVFYIDEEGARSRVVSARGVSASLLPALKLAAKGAGHINIVPDIDGKYRRVPLYIEYNGKLYPYLSFLTASDYLGVRQEDIKLLPGRFLLLGDKAKIPLDENSCMIINFSGRWGKPFRHYSFVDILQSYLSGVTGQKPILDLDVFKDKVCVIGLTATGGTDIHPNPWEILYPGMGVHAELFNGVLNNSFISRVSRGANISILLMLGVIIAAFTLKTRPVTGLYFLLITLAVFSASAVSLFSFYGLWIDLFYPLVVATVLYLVLTFYKYIAERQKRQLLEKELDIARAIQESFLPKGLPELEGVELAARMFTARQVGGDLYDFVDVGQGKVGIMIGDVSGKGIPASLFMAKVIGEFRLFAKTQADPSGVLASLNNKLVIESSSNLFVTVFYIILDPAKRKVSFASGGHMPAVLVKSSTGKTEFLDTKEGMPLGLAEGNFSEGRADLEKGDIIILYTDGVTEATDSHKRMYGAERLCELARNNRALSAADLLAVIREDARKFERGTDQHDDMTLFVAKMA